MRRPLANDFSGRGTARFSPGTPGPRHAKTLNGIEGKGEGGNPPPKG